MKQMLGCLLVGMLVGSASAAVRVPRVRNLAVLLDKAATVGEMYQETMGMACAGCHYGAYPGGLGMALQSVDEYKKSLDAMIHDKKIFPKQAAEKSSFYQHVLNHGQGDDTTQLAALIKSWIEAGASLAR
jgi:hypothetical protein